MRKFFLLILLLCLTSSLALCFIYNYSYLTVAFHMLIMLILQLPVFLLIALASLVIRRPKPFSYIFHFLLFLDLAATLVLYVMIIGSNHFWNKTITLPIIKNYFSNIGNFLSSLPVAKWMICAFCILLFIIIIILYRLFRPSGKEVYSGFQTWKNSRYFKISLIGFAIVVVCLGLFRSHIVRVKRIMQFNEEPVLQFALGNIWGEGNEIVFDKQRYARGAKDKACLDSLLFPAKDKERTFVVILVDALRSDHLPFYGYQRNTAPFLDSLHKTGSLQVIKYGFSSSTNTVGGVAGLFYSRDWENFGYNGLNLMKFLKKKNYHTYSFLTGYHRDWFGLSALYRNNSDYYYESPTDPSIPPDDDLVTMKKFMETKLEKKSFIYIHLLSTHTIGKKDATFRKYRPDKIDINVSRKEALVNNYDNGIIQADHVIKSVFQKLQREGYLKTTTVFIVSDHGELFGENGRWSHGGSIDPDLLNIPILVYDQDKNWYKNLNIATLKDIAPTIANRAGYPIPACWEGRSIHLPAKDFSMEINSVVDCQYPFGTLTVKDSIMKLEIRNAVNEVKSVSEKNGKVIY